MHRTRTTAVALGAALVLAAFAGGCTRNAEAFTSFQRINTQRVGQGLPALAIDDALVAKAQAWAETLAATGTVRHSVLADGVPAGWRFVGENVGSAGSVDQMHDLFMASAPHRANILDARPDRVGTGVAMAGGRVYVVQVFAAY
jgi:uncharacterized protein YkwD